MGYDPKQHSEECHKLNEKFEKAFKEYNEAWPDHCDNCRGMGGFAHPGSYWDPPDYEPCDECWAKGKCPRCGKEDAFATEDCEPPCKFCGWVDTDPGEPDPDFCWGDCLPIPGLDEL